MWGFESLRPHQSSIPAFSLVHAGRPPAQSRTFVGFYTVMKTVETENAGLKRAYTLTIPAADIDARVDGEIRRMAPKVKMPGFRPGKVPANLIRKMHGESLHAEALNTTVQESVQRLIGEQK